MNGAASVIANYAQLFSEIQALINAVTVTVGIFVAGYGLFKLFYSGQQGQGGSKFGAVVSLFVGSVMASMGYFMGVLTNTFFMSATPRSALSYAPPSGGDAAAVIVSSMLMLAALFGWYWALKGCYLVHRSAHPQLGEKDDRTRGVIRIAGAVGCTNLLFITNLIAAAGGFNNPLSGAL